MNRQDTILTRERILALFRILDEKMITAGVEGTVFVVGGAAIALAFDGERVTSDIDGRYENSKLDELILQVAREEDMPPDWLNHSVNTILIYFRKDDAPMSVFRGRMLTIDVASPEYVLAMKLASRRDKDVDDVLMLIKRLELSGKEEILHAVERYFMADLSAAAVQRRQIEEFLDMILEGK
jgi:hypothetical protein